MSRVEEIERAIQELNRDEFAQIAERVHALEQERWDEELDRDASSGKLDFLIAEAHEARKEGRLKDYERHTGKRPSFKEFLTGKGPSLEGLDPSRNRSAMREAKL